MKKTLSMILAVMFVLTSFGVATLFSGVISAGAVFFDYYEYLDIPGLNAFTQAELQESFMTGCEPAGNATIDGVGQVTQYTVKSKGQYSEIKFTTMKMRNQNNNSQGDPFTSAIWAGHSLLGGKDIFGDTGITFEDATGFCVWVGINGQPYTQNLKIQMFQVPCKGPYFQGADDGGDDLYEATTGCVYECSGKKGDEDGYVYFDFKTDFSQCDWWSHDDDGKNQFQQGITPVPQGNQPLLNGIQFLVFYPEVGDTVQIGGFKVYKDKRIHTDELVEYMDSFDALDPEAYTEESYAEATEVYLSAYDMANEPENYTQKEVDAMAKELRNAIANLKPMFHARDKEVKLAGFEVWDDDDFDEMTGGDFCIDTPAVETEENVPDTCEQSVIVMGNAQEGPPSYGWSIFASVIYNDDGEYEAVKNPFELQEGSKPMSESNGIRFWLKWDSNLSPVPQSMRVGVGSSADQVMFECEETAITLPTEEEGEKYIGIPWTAFWDVEGEEDIYDYIDNLDFIAIYLEDCTGAYYIADLHCFTWAVSEADMDALRTAINDTKAYKNTLSRDDWFPRSWTNLENAIAQAEALLGQYGVTEKEGQEAIDNLNKALNKLILLGDVAPIWMLDKIEILIKGAKTYWRGNVTPASYRELRQAYEEADEIMNSAAPNEEEAARLIANLEDKISKLQPITAGEKVTSILSFESYTSRDLNRATGDRTDGVVYSLDKEYAKLPAGYSQALKMVCTKDMGSENSDEHGMMQYKAMYREKGSNKVVPIKLGPANENTLIGDLTGTDGLCFWIGVNDVNLVQKCTLRFAVSNCTVSPLFEMAAIDIPLPTTGCGWMYIPWEYFEYYDEWTHGQPIDLAKIYFYIFRFDGQISAGLETYITGLHAYKNVTTGTWDAPAIANISDGQTIDLSDGEKFIPDWNQGFASLDGQYFVYGNEIDTNGEHDFEVINGNKSTKVHFTITGGTEVQDETPVVSGVTEGQEFDLAEADGPVITWTVGTATLNGAAFTNGTPVNEVGEYTLVVTNGTEQVTVHFSVKDTTPTPPPAVTKGDFDGDGAITVADALAALRIGAKLVDETPKFIATGDVDGDGHVTVADALAILRVAAKLADHL